MTRKETTEKQIKVWQEDNKTNIESDDATVEARLPFEKLVNQMGDKGDINITDINATADESLNLIKDIREFLGWEKENLHKKIKPITLKEQRVIDDIITWYESFALGTLGRTDYQSVLTREIQRDKRLLGKSSTFIKEYKRQTELKEINSDLNRVSSSYSADDKNHVKKVLDIVLDKMENKSNAQKWLDKEHPKEERKEKIALDVTSYVSEDLWGSLDLSDFVKLEKLFCHYGQLTDLTLPVNNRIKRLICSDNQFTNLPLNLNPDTLTSLNISNNKIKSDLSIFAQLINLEVLNIQNTINENNIRRTDFSLEKDYNQFADSLKPLANLTKLKSLYISNNRQIDSGLEYLPKSLEKFECEGTQIVKELETYGKPEGGNYLSLLQLWRKDHQQLIAQVQVAPITNL